MTEHSVKRNGTRFWRVLVAVVVSMLVAASCGSESQETTGVTTASETADTAEDVDTTDADLAMTDNSLNVVIVGNPQMEDIANLTPQLFTAETGIEVNYSILEEATLREIVTRGAAGGGDQFDVVMIGMYETPQFGAAGWLTDLTPYAEADADYALDDVIPGVRNGLSVDGSLFASPFYAESSFLMYRQDVLDAAGLTMPDAPTWDEVAEIARAIDTPERAGICLRGMPGWGNIGASFGTVLNTFGGTWWAANGDGSIGPAQVDQPEFREAVEFYVDLVADAGQDDAENHSFNECLSQYQDGTVAMWYDATVAAGILEAEDSPVRGLNGYALAPTKVTDASGWLWAWSLAIPQNAPNPDLAWEYISWATGPGYIAAAGDLIPGGWAAIPPGTRNSTYAHPQYQEAASAFADRTLEAMEAAPVEDPGTTPRPGLSGTFYVGVPEFQEMANLCTELMSEVIAEERSVDDFLTQCQKIAAVYSS